MDWGKFGELKEFKIIRDNGIVSFIVVVNEKPVLHRHDEKVKVVYTRVLALSFFPDPDVHFYVSGSPRESVKSPCSTSLGGQSNPSKLVKLNLALKIMIP